MTERNAIQLHTKRRWLKEHRRCAGYMKHPCLYDAPPLCDYHYSSGRPSTDPYRDPRQLVHLAEEREARFFYWCWTGWLVVIAGALGLVTWNLYKALPPAGDHFYAGLGAYSIAIGIAMLVVPHIIRMRRTLSQPKPSDDSPNSVRFRRRRRSRTTRLALEMDHFLFGQAAIGFCIFLTVSAWIWLAVSA
ncbi:MAG: hypothetical protein F4095_15415 [Acidimicrobiia bacterium]|nr:hypothetical protein [Rhodospirillaceae bacterium]MYJ63693.1 hypothetical protein [Acidimicrobiia bacterium]